MLQAEITKAARRFTTPRHTARPDSSAASCRFKATAKGSSDIFVFYHKVNFVRLTESGHTVLASCVKVNKAQGNECQTYSRVSNNRDHLIIVIKRNPRITLCMFDQGIFSGSLEV